MARVFANDFRRRVRWQVADNRFPRLAEIAGHENERRIDVAAVAVDSHVGGPFLEMRSFNAAYVEVFRDPCKIRRHVRPRGAAILGHLDVAVIGAGPDDRRLQRRLGEADDGAMRLGARAGSGHLLRVLCREVRADGIPAIAALGQLEELIAAEIERLWVVVRNHKRRVPIEAVAGLTFFGHRPQAFALAGAEVEP